MFYVFDDEVKSIDVDEIGKNMLTLGFITVGELERLAAVFSLPKNIIELCRKKSDSSFLTKFINDDFSFIRINIICNKTESNNELAIIISKNIMIIGRKNNNVKVHIDDPWRCDLYRRILLHAAE